MSEKIDFENLPIFLLEEIDAIWFPNEPPTKPLKDNPGMINFYKDLIRGIWFGDETILLQKRGEKVMKLLQSYNLINPSLSAKELAWEGKKRSIDAFRKAFNSPKVQKAFTEMLGAVSDTLKSIKNIERERAEKEALKKIRTINQNQLN
jgi:hypothetical protein